MLRYYYTIAFRNAIRNKLYAIISVVGLALGLSASLMIGIYVEDELSVWVFIGAGILTLILALSTVFVHAFLIAGTKPITALRYE